MDVKKIETVALVGLGAIGGAYLGRIAETHPLDKIRVIAGGERALRYREQGVTTGGKTYRFPVVEPGEEGEPADLLLIAVKAHQLEQAARDARGLVGPDTVVLSLLNGITSEDVAGEILGREKVLESLAIGIDAVRTGDTTVYSGIGRIQFGDKKNDPSALGERVSRVKEFFDRVNIPYEIPADMVRTAWFKYMINVGVNQVTAVLRTPYGMVQREGAARDLIRAAMGEVVRVSAQVGAGLTEEDIEQALAVMDKLSPTGKTSMLQDVEAGRSNEVEIFSGTLLALGREAGLELPVNGMLYRLLKALDEIARLEG